MSETIGSRIHRLKIVSTAVLLVGFASSLAVYIVADQGSDDTAGYDMAGGNLYPSANERSKKYMHDVELYGGKAAVLADDINRCYNGLWQGTTLAYTMAFLTVMVSGGIFLAARYSQAGEEEAQDKGDEGGG